MRTAFLVLIAMFLATPAFSQTPKIPVYIQQSGNDQTGKNIAFRLRDQLASSGMFTPSTDSGLPGYHIVLTTMGTDYSTGGMTVYSAVLTFQDKDVTPFFLMYDTAYVDNAVGNCGVDAAEKCAGQIYEYLGRRMTQDMDAMRNFLKAVSKPQPKTAPAVPVP